MAYTMTDIDERGVTDVVSEAIDVATDCTDGVHVSLDMDWLDPTEASGVGTPERGGVSYREAHASMEHIERQVTRAGLLSSRELVEVNPILANTTRRPNWPWNSPRASSASRSSERFGPAVIRDGVLVLAGLVYSPIGGETYLAATW